MRIRFGCPINECEAVLTADVTTPRYRPGGMPTPEDAHAPEIEEIDGCQHAVSYNAGRLPARHVTELEDAVIEALESSMDDHPDRDDD